MTFHGFNDATSTIAARRVVVGNNLVVRCLTGMHVLGDMAGLVFGDNLIDDCNRGYFFKDVHNVSVMGGAVTGCADVGVLFDALGKCRNVALTGITIANNRGETQGTGGIYAFNVENLIISVCVMTDNYDRTAGNGTAHQLRSGGGNVNMEILGNIVSAGVAQAVTLEGSGTTATVLQAEHGYKVGDSATIAGATDTDYNGTFTVATVPNQGVWTYTAGGTLSANDSGTAQTTCSGNGILTRDSDVNVVVSSNVVDIQTGTNISIATPSATVTGNTTARSLNITSSANDCVVTGNYSHAATSNLQGSDCTVTGNRWNGTLNVSGDDNQLVGNRLNGGFNVSGDNSLLAYNNKASTDTGTGTNEVVWV